MGEQALVTRAREFLDTLAACGVIDNDALESVWASCEPKLHAFAQRELKRDETSDVAILWVPLVVMYSLRGVAPVSSWDFEGGYREMCKSFEGMFEITEHGFRWTYDHTITRLVISLNDRNLVLDLDVDEDVQYEPYGRISSFVSDELAQHGQFFFEIATGDQTSMELIVPAGSESKISEFLVSVHDPRARLLYGGS